MRIFVYFIIMMFAVASCNSEYKQVSKPISEDTVAIKVASVETIGSQTVFADSSVAYAYIKSVFKKSDFVFIAADFIQYLTGDRAVAEAQKNGDADTSYNEK